MHNASQGPTAFMPDMRRNIYDPALVLHYSLLKRGDPVADHLPLRVKAALADIERQEMLSNQRRVAQTPLLRIKSKIRRLLARV